MEHKWSNKKCSKRCVVVVVVPAGVNTVKPEVQGNVAHGNFVACFSSEDPHKIPVSGSHNFKNEAFKMTKIRCS